MKLYVDAIATPTIDTDAPIDIDDVLHETLWIAILIGVLVLISEIVDSASEFVGKTQNRQVTNKMYEILHNQSISVSMEYYENPKYHDMLQRASREAVHRPTRIIDNLMDLCKSSVLFVGMFSVLVNLHWLIIFPLFTVMIPMIFFKISSAKEMYEWQRRQTYKERRSTYLHWLISAGYAAREIRVLGIGSFLSKWYSRIKMELHKGSFSIELRCFVKTSILQVFPVMVYVGFLIFLAYQVIQGERSIGDFVLYQQAFQRGEAALKTTIDNFAKLYENRLFLKNLYEFLDIDPSVNWETKGQIITRKPILQGIEFDDVSFRYPDGEEFVLENINIMIRPGETVALVGENGAGKTTLVKLLCKFCRPERGRITVDNIDLHQIRDLDHWNNLSVVFQDPIQYHFSVRENIWIGNIGLGRHHEKLTSAAKRAGIHETVQKLANGYDTILSKWYNQGTELSGGEWQKIAVARSFFRDSALLILDEPTSALDAEAEMQFFSSIKSLAEEKATLIISHRFSTVKNADRIYVLDRGKIVEDGSHNELMKLNGKYAYMFNIQAQNYR